MTSPVLRDFPGFFETERLIVRCFKPGDGPVVNAAIVESLENLRPWMPWAQTAPTIEQTEEHLRRAQAHWIERTDLPLGIWVKETGEYVGGTGLHRMDWEVPRFEIGYWCSVRFEGRGYITEAVRGLTRFAFDVLGANRVEIRCHTVNIRSRAVAERAGYPLEATLRNHVRGVDGTLRDMMVFTLLPEEYRARYG
jgi:RimJ/RimL family protein N-acetyltransferase